jgi:hypothetical protein
MNPTPAPSVGTQAIPPYRLPPMNLAKALPDVEGYDFESILKTRSRQRN